MNFIEAYKALIKGKKVRQLDWDKGDYIEKGKSSNEDCYTCNSSFREEDGTSYELCGVDYLANDWELYEEECKLHTFEEVLVAFRAGKTISREDKNDRNLRYKIGWSTTLHFKEEDLLANDWVIIDKEDK